MRLTLILLIITQARAGCWNKDYYYDDDINQSNGYYYYGSCSMEPWAAWLLFCAFFFVPVCCCLILGRRAHQRRQSQNLSLPQTQAPPLAVQQSVVVPFNTDPGSSIDVTCNSTGKVFKAIVPAGMTAGQVFMVNSPY